MAHEKAHEVAMLAAHVAAGQGMDIAAAYSSTYKAVYEFFTVKPEAK